MRIMVNGQWRQQDRPLSVMELLGELSLDSRRVAVEVNGHLVTRARHEATVLADEDRLEIVTLVGGG